MKKARRTREADRLPVTLAVVNRGTQAFEERLLFGRGQARGTWAVDTAGVFVGEGGVDGVG